MRPSYAWQTMHNRLLGLEQTGEEDRLRVDFQTFVTLGPGEDEFSVSLYEHRFARVTPKSVTVWYTQQNPTLHRRLNEVLRSVGWAVVERDREWSLVRRGWDGGIAHPFPRDMEVMVTIGETAPTYYTETAL